MRFFIRVLIEVISNMGHSHSFGDYSRMSPWASAWFFGAGLALLFMSIFTTFERATMLLSLALLVVIIVANAYELNEISYMRKINVENKKKKK